MAPPCIVDECKLTTDVILITSDGHKFGAHSKNLEAHGEAFPPISSTSQSNVPFAHLTELSDVVKLILQLVHLQRWPDLGEIPFQLLDGLADATEKYLMFPAMAICKIHMEAATSSHPFEVLLYSAKHGYMEIANKAAYQTLPHWPDDEMTSRLMERPDTFLAWMRYREHCNKEIRSMCGSPPVAGLHKGGVPDCDQWISFHRGILSDIAAENCAIWKLSTIIDDNMKAHLEDCSQCATRATRLLKSALNIRATIPPFRSFFA